MTIKVIYFAGRGRAEATRMALAYGGIDFEDVRETFATIGQQKAIAPFGQFPLLVVDGKVIAQSSTMLRYAGKKAGLYPADEIEAYQAESIVDQISDIGNLLSGIAFNRELDEAGKAAAIEKARKGTLPKMFAGLVTYQGDKDFFFAKESIADFALYGLIEGMKAFMPIVEIVQEIAPSLFKIVDSVNKLPQLADYYVKRDNVEAAEAAAKGSN